MNKIVKHLSLCCAISCSALMAASAFASQSLPSNLDDIVYADAEWGSKQLRKRGYTLISSHNYNGQEIQYWWDGNTNICLQAKKIDYKYDALKTTSPTDCNQYHKEATKDNNSAGIAIAAAAIIGAAVLASKSHHRGDEYSKNANLTAQFDRGFRDGLHQKGYHNYDNQKAYSDGYNQGQIERDEQTQHHSRAGRYSGYQSYQPVNDLVGARAAGAETELQTRNFKNTGGYKKGNKSYTTWWNSRTRQCISVVTKEGRIKKIEPVIEGNCI